MTNLAARVETALGGNPGRVIAYMCGQRTRAYTPVLRAELAELFARHGFDTAADSLLAPDGDPLRALQASVSRRSTGYATRAGAKLSNGSEVTFKVDKLPTDDDAVKSWGIYRADRARGERGARWHYGARVYASADGTIAAADPVDSATDADCLALAERIAGDARTLLHHADTVDVSTALTAAYQQAGCYPFVARGCYLASADAEPTARLVACLTEIRQRYYSEADRAGIRVSAIRVTEADAASVSDAVVDDVERQCSELADALRDYAGRDAAKAPRGATLERRVDAARALLAQIERQRSIMGAWADRFAAQVASLRDAYAQGVAGYTLDLPDWCDAEPDSCPVAAPAPAKPADPEPVPPAPTPAPAPALVAEPDLGVLDF